MRETARTRSEVYKNLNNKTATQQHKQSNNRANQPVNHHNSSGKILRKQQPVSDQATDKAQLKSLSRTKMDQLPAYKKFTPSTMEKKKVLPKIPRRSDGGDLSRQPSFVQNFSIKPTTVQSVPRQPTIPSITRQGDGEQGGGGVIHRHNSRREKGGTGSCSSFIVDNAHYAKFSRTSASDELSGKRKDGGEQHSTETGELSSVKIYESGKILEETKRKMQEIDRRNSQSKARRESIHFSIEKKTLIDIGKSQDDTDESGDGGPADEFDPLSYAAVRDQPEAQQQQLKRDRRSESIKPSPRKKLPPISRHAHSFNEFDHKRLSRQASQKSESSGSQTSLNKRRISNANHSNSMFTLKSKPQREAVGIVSHVTGDLSVKLTKAKPRGLQGPIRGDFDLEEYLAHIPRASKGTRKLRPLSTDIRINKTSPLRRTKSSNPAMVVCSLKPDISDYMKKQKSIGGLVDTKPMLRSSFQRAVMAVRATNRIQNINKVWRV